MRIKLLVACWDPQTAVELCASVCGAACGPIAAASAPMNEVLSQAALAKPDVLMMEFAPCEDEQAWRILSGLFEVSPRTRALMLCETCCHSTILGAIQHGASGCMPRSSKPAMYAKAVQAVNDGESWFGRTELVQALRQQAMPEPAFAPHLLDSHGLLTAREQQIMAFIGKAMTNKEIARRLKISDQTVKTHLHHIYVKLHKSGRYKAFLSNTAVELGPQAPAVQPGQLEIRPGIFGGGAAP